MKFWNNNHLMYCLNIHPGELWEENLWAIRHYALKVKERVCPDSAFALGLRLSANASGVLLTKVEEFKEFLHTNNLYVVTVNGFPYGSFHNTIIKENVFRPDWASALRKTYTLDLAKIMACLLPEGQTGTISTVPCYYGKKERPSAVSNILSVATALSELEEKTGKHIILALEPEPDCCMDSLNSTLDLFEKFNAKNISASNHLGICLDTCHVAVEFESPLFWLKTLSKAGIQVPKIQISAALQTEISASKEANQIFAPFTNNEYLHQTRILRKGSILRFRDLPYALEEPFYEGEWRVHFHVPLTWRGENISSTAGLIENDFFKEACSEGGKHFEIETYSFMHLPHPKPSIVDSIVSEFEWAKGKLFNITGSQGIKDQRPNKKYNI